MSIPMEQTAHSLPSVIKPVAKVVDHRQLNEDHWGAILRRSSEIKVELG